VDSNCPQTDSQPKSVGLVWRSVAVCCSVCICHMKLLDCCSGSMDSSTRNIDIIITIIMWYGDSVSNTIEKNCSVFNLIPMC